MISLNIQADTPEELAAVLKTLGGVFTTAPAEDAPLSDDLVQAMARTVQEEPADAPAPVAEKQEPVEEPASPVEQPKAPEPPAVPVVKMEDARAALNELRQKKGADAVRSLLQKHNVQSFIDLKASEYPTIIKEAKEYE